MPKTRFAFFDVDKTIFNGYTASDFLLFAANQKVAQIKYKEQYLKALEQYKAGRIEYNEAAQICLDLFSQMVKGMSVSRIRQLVRKMFSQMDYVIYPWVFPVINHLRRLKFKTILISAGPDIAIELINRQVKADQFMATYIDRVDGVFYWQISRNFK